MGPGAAYWVSQQSYVQRDTLRGQAGAVRAHKHDPGILQVGHGVPSIARTWQDVLLGRVHLMEATIA
jgi:hypothetical protein